MRYMRVWLGHLKRSRESMRSIQNTKAISRIDDEHPSWLTFLNTPYNWLTSCLLGPTDHHLEEHGLMEGSQRGAKTGCTGMADNLLIDRVVTSDCQSRRRYLNIVWVDAKKVYDSVDHGWLGEMMVLHGFPKWLHEVICKLCKSWNTRIVAKTLHRQEFLNWLCLRRAYHREMRSIQGCLRSVCAPLLRPRAR